MKRGLEMSGRDFCKDIFYPRATVLTAIGGSIAGRFYGIPPMHAAVYAVASRSIGQAAFRIGEVVLGKSYNMLSELRLKKSFIKLILTPSIMASVYIVFTASNQVLSLVGRPLVFATAAKISFASGVVGFFSGLFIDYMIGNKR